MEILQKRFFLFHWGQNTGTVEKQHEETSSTHYDTQVKETEKWLWNKKNISIVQLHEATTSTHYDTHVIKTSHHANHKNKKQETVHNNMYVYVCVCLLVFVFVCVKQETLQNNMCVYVCVSWFVVCVCMCKAGNTAQQHVCVYVCVFIRVCVCVCKSGNTAQQHEATSSARYDTRVLETAHPKNVVWNKENRHYQATTWGNDVRRLAYMYYKNSTHKKYENTNTGTTAQ